MGRVHFAEECYSDVQKNSPKKIKEYFSDPCKYTLYIVTNVHISVTGKEDMCCYMRNDAGVMSFT